MMMVSRNLQDDDDHSVKRHNDPPPADVGDIIAASANWIVFDEISPLSVGLRYALLLCIPARLLIVIKFNSISNYSLLYDIR